MNNISNNINLANINNFDNNAKKHSRFDLKTGENGSFIPNNEEDEKLEQNPIWYLQELSFTIKYYILLFTYFFLKFSNL